VSSEVKMPFSLEDLEVGRGFAIMEGGRSMLGLLAIGATGRRGLELTWICRPRLCGCACAAW
jgi:hypothetical protein